MHGLRRSKVPILTFFFYLATSLFYFGAASGYNNTVFGYGGDSFTFVWCLDWWPWSITHGLNPFVSQKVWFPEGTEITWVSSTPALSLIGLPLTLLGGPIVTFNTLCILAPTLAAWAAFLLMHHITRDKAAALVGGYVFGFSSYEFGHVLGHLNLSTTCVVPLLLLVCLKRISGGISRFGCISLLSIALLVQFGISIEIFCTVCVFALLSWLVFLFFVANKQRRRLCDLAVEFVAALGLTTLFVSPFLFFLLRGMHNLPATLNSPEMYSTDLLNFLVPTVLTSLGNAYFAPISSRFTGNLAEQSAYLGLPAILILTAFFARRLTIPSVRAMLVMLLLLILCSLGPTLWLNGIKTGLWLPWAWVDRLPLIRSALPGRFTLYIFLLTGIAMSLWLAEQASSIKRVRRFSLAIMACLFMLPNRTATAHWTSAELLPFFDKVRNGSMLKPDQNVLLLPFGVLGANMIWQWQARYSFTQSGGGAGLVPRSEAVLPVVGALSSGQIVPGLGQMILDYCRTHRVTAIVAGPNTAPALMDVLQTIGWPSSRHDGVVLFSDPLSNTR